MVMGEDDASLGGAIEFGEDNAVAFDGLGEGARLMKSVLPCDCVEGEKDSDAGIGDVARDNALDLLKLLHEVGLGVKASGSIDDHDIGVTAQGGGDGVECNGAGVGSLTMRDYVHVEAPSPRTELLRGARRGRCRQRR